MIRHFIQDEEGQVLVEYGLLIALIALVAVSAVALFGTKVKHALYDNAANQLPG